MSRKTVLLALLVVCSNLQVLANKDYHEPYLLEKYKHNYTNYIVPETKVKDLACQAGYTRICKVKQEDPTNLRYCFTENATFWTATMDSKKYEIDYSTCEPTKHEVKGNIDDITVFDFWSKEYLFGSPQVGSFIDDTSVKTYTYCVVITDQQEKTLYRQEHNRKEQENPELNQYDYEIFSERRIKNHIQVGTNVVYTDIACGKREYVEAIFNEKTNHQYNYVQYYLFVLIVVIILCCYCMTVSKLACNCKSNNDQKSENDDGSTKEFKVLSHCNHFIVCIEDLKKMQNQQTSKSIHIESRNLSSLLTSTSRMQISSKEYENIIKKHFRSTSASTETSNDAQKIKENSEKKGNK